MPAFTTAEEITHWLGEKTRDVAGIFVARLAIRVIPILATQSELAVRGPIRIQGQVVLVAFRCVSAAWAVAAAAWTSMALP